MAKRSSAPAHGLKSAALIRTLVHVGALWTASDLGFYLVLPALGLQASYNAHSVAVALYYVFWAGLAVITLWPVYRTWHNHSRWITLENRLASSIVWSLAFAGSILFAAYVLPSLPSAPWTESWTPPEVRVATPAYFLPKSIEILFQQLLVAALVLALAAERYSIRRISFYCALVFGSAHLLLALGGMPLGYVVRFMLAATAFGLMFPYLILRVPNGLAYSYIVHWVYYAVTVLMPRIFASPA